MKCPTCSDRGVILRSPGVNGGSPAPCPTCRCPVETPEPRDAHAEGADAFLAGRGEDANPYDPERDEQAHLLWNDGWIAAAEA